MRPLRLSLVVLPLMAALAVVVAGSPVAAAPIFGSLSNFDVVNDTGQVTRGFEIELDGISSADVVYTFGAPYERYGNPTKVDFAGGVFVRYQSPYDAINKVFTQGTPVPPNPGLATLGHQCWTGGSVDYATSGCEHFGVSLTRNPTNTIYRWLSGDPNTGQLTPVGTNVPIPAPVWNVSPQPAAPPIVKAVVVAPPPPPIPPAGPAQWGQAIWQKIFVTELGDKLNPQDLVHLVLDDPNVDIVPDQQGEVEIEWKLLQSAPPGENGPNEESENGGEAGQGKEAVSRRYEFYKYTGPYDPESHEALCDDPTQNCFDANGDPFLDPIIGNFIGAQNAAVNLAPFAPPPGVPEPATLSLVGLGLAGLALHGWRRRSQR